MNRFNGVALEHHVVELKLEDVLREILPSKRIPIAVRVALLASFNPPNPVAEKDFPEPVREAILLFRSQGRTKMVRDQVSASFREFYDRNRLMGIPESDSDAFIEGEEDIEELTKFALAA